MHQIETLLATYPPTPIERRRLKYPFWIQQALPGGGLPAKTLAQQG